MDIKTHEKIDQSLCGKPLQVEEGYSRVELTPTGSMVADDSGLIHGGFIFGMADYAAMLAVNHPNVVLGASDVKFLKPVKVSETVIAEAKVGEQAGKKRIAAVTVSRKDEPVFEGTFTCFVLDNHVLG
ncbi:MAG: thioesterase [Deltaproteobacteria bacterium SG8_13]|nr:MAG: thioesterase [Deltaproteobacteria bacterium SG8_13]